MIAKKRIASILGTLPIVASAFLLSSVQSPAIADDAPPKAPFNFNTFAPPGYVNVKLFGAQGNGKTDDQLAIEKAIIFAKATHRGIFVPNGFFVHSQVLNLTGVNVLGLGFGSQLIGTTAGENALVVDGGSATTIRGINVRCATGPIDFTNGDGAAVWLNNCSKVNLIGCYLPAGLTWDVLMTNDTSCYVGSNRITTTRGEGIEVVHCTSCTIRRNAITDNDTGAIPINIDTNSSFSTMPSTNISILDNSINAFTFDIQAQCVIGLLIQGNTLTNTGNAAALTINNGGVGQVISGVQILSNRITGSDPHSIGIGIFESATQTLPFNVVVQGNIVTAGLEPLEALGFGSGSSLTCSNNQFIATSSGTCFIECLNFALSFTSNTVTGCLFETIANGQNITISNNNFANAHNTSEVMLALDTNAQLTITNNFYAGPKNALTLFILAISSPNPTVASGNTNAVGLGNFII